MFFDWDEYESLSDTEDVSLLLSERSQQLVLSAMEMLEFRSRWGDIDDATYDDIQAAVAEAYEEIMESVVPMASAGAFSVFRNTNSGLLPSGGFQTVPVAEMSDPDGICTINGSGQIVIANAGWYDVKCVLNIQNSATAATAKLMRLRNITQAIDATIGMSEGFAASQIIRGWFALNDIFECDAGDTLAIQIHGGVSGSTVVTDGALGGVTPNSLLATFMRFK